MDVRWRFFWEDCYHAKVAITVALISGFLHYNGFVTY